jgi:cytochrome P450
MYLAFVVVLVILALVLLSRSKKRVSTGYQPSDQERGNFPEIVKAGSVVQFLTQSHKRFGPIFDFWYGKQHAVSIADLEMFKAVRHLHTRPAAIFEPFVPVVGPKSILVSNGTDATRRRQLYHNPILNVNALQQNLVPRLNEVVANDVLPYFEARANTGQPTKLTEATLDYTVQAIASLVVGAHVDKADVLTIMGSHNVVIDSAIATYLGAQMSEEDEQAFTQQFELIVAAIVKLLGAPKETEGPSMQQLLASESDQVAAVNDMITFIVTGFHNINNVLQWSLYLAAKHPEEQEKVYRELINCGPDLSSKIETLPVLRNFIDEVLRWSALGTYAGRVSEDKDIVLPGGLVIPKGTLIFMSLKTVLRDPTLWDSPKQFIPDRFNDPASRGFKFCQFGFAGGRSCPGRALTYTESKIFIAEVLRQFVVSLPDANYSLKKKFALQSRLDPEVELIITRR